MNSIDRQQPEENRKDLDGQEAIEKIRELSGKAQTCFFCTHMTEGGPFHARPMSVQRVDDKGNIWFLSANDSHKNIEIGDSPYIQLLFQGSHYSDFMSLYGKAVVSRDKEKIKQLWDPIAKNWFTGGLDDPRITVIRMTPEEGYYWDTKHNTMVAFAKQLVGSITGQTLDDSVQGTMTL